MLERGGHAFQEQHRALRGQNRIALGAILISLTACRTRAIAGVDFQPKAPRRNRRVNSQ